MHGFSALRRAKRHTRAIVAVAAALLLLGLMGGTALAVTGVTTGTRVQIARTYYVTPITAPHEEMNPTSVTWPRIGQVSLSSDCWTNWNRATGQYGVGMKALVIKNTGNTPVALAFGVQDFRWLQPGELDAFIVVGELVNDQTPDPKAGTTAFSVLAAHGASASGTFAWSARWQPSNHTGHCAFTLQMRG